jgi:hypothetical protein
LVCGGVLVLQTQPDRPASKFRVPYLNGKWIVPLLFVVALAIVLMYAPEHFKNAFTIEGFPMILFWIIAVIVSVMTFIKNFSLIPVLGLTSCFYLMAQESHTNWYRFLIWLVVGLVIYFLYGRYNSHLAKPNPLSSATGGRS